VPGALLPPGMSMPRRLSLGMKPDEIREKNSLLVYCQDLQILLPLEQYVFVLTRFKREYLTSLPCYQLHYLSLNLHKVTKNGCP
jgi:hypothetical protein